MRWRGEGGGRAKKNSCETLIIKDCHFRVMIFSQRELQKTSETVDSKHFRSDYYSTYYL